MSKDNLKLLVVEDNPGDFYLLQEILSEVILEKCTLYNAVSLHEAYELNAKNSFDLILLDLGLPDSKGLDTFERMHTHAPNQPIVILSGQQDEDLALTAVQHGAQDYIRKGCFDGTLLYRAICYAIERKRLEIKIRENEEKYRLLTENMVDVIWQMSFLPSSRISIDYVSPSIVNLLQYTPEEMSRIPLAELMTRASWEKLKDLAQEDMSTTESCAQEEMYFRLDIEQICKDGTSVWTETRARKIHDEQGVLTGAQGVTRDITERKQLEKQLEEMSFQDALTGLYSRRFFEQELKRLQDGRHLPLGLIACDINNLKMVNDNLGHEYGDQLIQQVAKVIQSSFRQSDIVARIGGDEFAVLLPSTSKENIEKACRRISSVTPEKLLNTIHYPVGISVGYSVAETAPVNTSWLLKEADNAMYQNKKAHQKTQCSQQN